MVALRLPGLTPALARLRPARVRDVTLAQALADERRYRAVIDRLHERHLRGPGLHGLRQGEVSLASVVLHRDEVARLLARAVAAGEYRFGVGERRTIRTAGKERTVYAFEVADLVVQGVVCDIIAAASEPLLTPQLYSYRPGVPWWRAAQDLARFVRRERRAGRSVFVVRRDVAAYTDSIPVRDGAPVWAVLFGALEAWQGGRVLSAAEREVVAWVVRPEIRAAGGGVSGSGGAGDLAGVERLDTGVPTGQPISVLLFNLALAALDREMAAVSGGFWARYSDDLVFAHPDAAVARAAAATVERVVAEAGLTLNAAKGLDVHLGTAGHRSPAWSEAAGRSSVAYLGLRVTAMGTLGLDGPKAREVVRDVRRRAAAGAAAAPLDDIGARTRLACAVVRRALESGDPDTAGRSARLLETVVTDRAQLRELDALIARAVASAITGRPGVRALRLVSPRTLRAAGLPSLVARRNAVGKRRRGRGR